jgi:translocation protein SEC66
MAQNTLLRERLDAITSRAAGEKQWWESRRAAIQADFMKELDDDKAKSSADEGVLV